MKQQVKTEQKVNSRKKKQGRRRMREVKTTEMQIERNSINYFHVCSGSHESQMKKILRHIEDVLLFILKCDILQAEAKAEQH